MLLMAGAAPGMSLVDPFCGTGTILIEAALQRLRVIGGDLQPTAARHAMTNAGNAQVHSRILRWDARKLPLAPASVDLAVSNLPWGRQIVVDADLAALYRESVREMRRVVKPGGSIMLLTGAPELVNAPEAETMEISLFGQNPHLIKIRNAR